MKCPQCGSENLDGARSCMNCGAVLGSESRDAGAPHDELPSKQSANAWLWVFLALGCALALGLVFNAGGGGGGGGGAIERSGSTTTTLDPKVVASQVTSAAADDAAVYAKKDYAGVYRRLASSDQTGVTEAEWVARCQAVENAAGAVVSSRIVGLGWLDVDKQIVEVKMEMRFASSPTSQTTTTYYVLEGGRWAQSMLWGREFEYSPSPLP